MFLAFFALVDELIKCGLLNTVMFRQWALDIQNDNFKYKLSFFPDILP